MNSMAMTRDVENSSKTDGIWAVGSLANWMRQRCMVRRSAEKSSSRFRVRSNSRASAIGR